MADDVKILPSVDVNAVPVAADEIAGIFHQRVKAEWGPSDTATQVDDTAAARLPIGGGAVGSLTEAAPGNDTASSGLNGRLQRIAQNVTTLIGRFPATAALADAVANPTLSQVAAFLHTYNGTTWDRLRSASGDTLAAAGVLAAANMVFNGATWDRLRIASGDAQGGTGMPAAGNMAFNGTNWDRLRTASADALAATGLAAAGNLLYNGTTWDRVRGDITNGLDVDVTRLPSLVAGTAAIGRFLLAETTVTCSVAISGTTGASCDIRGYTVSGIIVPSTFDGTQIQYEVSVDNSTWFPLYDVGNNRVIQTVSASRAYPVYGETFGWNYLRVVTLTAQATTTTDFLLQLKAS